MFKPDESSRAAKENIIKVTVYVDRGEFLKARALGKKAIVDESNGFRKAVPANYLITRALKALNREWEAKYGKSDC